jgi:tRNA A37 threonylcarbamoyladenosine modification protein TsaB
LLFQVAKENAISLLTIDNKASKFHVAIYQEKKCLLTPKITNKEELEELKKDFLSFAFFQDFSQVEFLKNFFLKKEYFQKLKNINEIL